MARRPGEGCEALQVAFAAEAAVPKDPSGKLDSLVSHCVRSRLELAAQASSPQEREQALAWLEASKLPLTDGQRQEIDALRRAASEAPPTP